MVLFYEEVLSKIEIIQKPSLDLTINPKPNLCFFIYIKKKLQFCLKEKEQLQRKDRVE